VVTRVYDPLMELKSAHLVKGHECLRRHPTFSTKVVRKYAWGNGDSDLFK